MKMKKSNQPIGRHTGNKHNTRAEYKQLDEGLLEACCFVMIGME